MKEIVENDFNTFIVNNPFGLIVFMSYSSFYTFDQRSHLIDTPDNVGVLSIETLSEKTIIDYGIDHTPYWFAFKQQNFIFRQPGLLSREDILKLLAHLQRFDMSYVSHETGEVIR